MFWLFFRFYNDKYSIKNLTLRVVPNSNSFLEFTWTVVPMVIFFIIFLPLMKLLSYIGYYFVIDRKFFADYYLSRFFSQAPYSEESTVSIKCIGNQWYWLYESSYDISRSYNSFSEETLSSYLDFKKLNLGGEVDLLDQSYALGALDSLWQYKLRLVSTDYFLIVPFKQYVQFYITSYDVIHN